MRLGADIAMRGQRLTGIGEQRRVHARFSPQRPLSTASPAGSLGSSPLRHGAVQHWSRRAPGAGRDALDAGGVRRQRAGAAVGDPRQRRRSPRREAVRGGGRGDVRDAGRGGDADGAGLRYALVTAF